ncbi:MAG: 50S ribosomal protein L20 [Gammaproteobacteria bacterium]
MTRATQAVVRRKRHKKILQQASGYRGARSRNFRTALPAVIKASQYAYRDRRQNKREFRRLWIQRLNAACRLNGTNYSRFMHQLGQSGIELDRKVLAEMAVHDAKNFANLVKQLNLSG